MLNFDAEVDVDANVVFRVNKALIWGSYHSQMPRLEYFIGNVERWT